MRTTVLVSVLAVFGAFMPSAAFAQRRHGALFSLGGGPGSASTSCDGCSGGRITAAAGSIRVGVSLTERVVVGADVSLWVNVFSFEQDFSTTVSLYHVAGTVTYYPRAKGLFVKGGIGVATADVTTRQPGTTTIVDIGRGLAVTGGIGYDTRISRRWSVTPAVSFSYGRLGDATFAGQTFRNVNQNVIAFTISVTYR